MLAFTNPNWNWSFGRAWNGIITSLRVSPYNRWSSYVIGNNVRLLMHRRIVLNSLASDLSPVAIALRWSFLINLLISQYGWLRQHASKAIDCPDNIDCARWLAVSNFGLATYELTRVFVPYKTTWMYSKTYDLCV